MALERILSYGGVNLLLDVAKVYRMPFKHSDGEDAKALPPLKHQPEADLIDELNRLLPFQYLNDFQLSPDSPGRNLDGIARTERIGPQPGPDVRINDYYYPTSASRWSVFRGLATSSQVTALEALTQTASNTVPRTFLMQAAPYGAGNLLNQPGKYQVQTQLYMAPPRPLGEAFGPFDGLFLVTLFDERYFWKDTPVTLHLTQGTQWADLINQIGVILGVAIGLPFPIQSAYGTPEADSQLWTNAESAAVLLDAIAYNLGRVVVRNLDGSYDLMNPFDSLAIVQENRGAANQVTRTAGGDIFQIPKQPIGNLSTSRNLLLPSAVTVTFPKYVYGDDPVPHLVNPRYQNQRPSAWYEDSYGDVFSISVPLNSGFLQSVSGNIVSGLTGTASPYVIHSTAKALYSGEASTNTPVNLVNITSLANQIAFDYYNNQVNAALDESYPGTFAWNPEGIHDIIWTYSARVRQATCRVTRTQWNNSIREMQQSPYPLGAIVSGNLSSGTVFHPSGFLASSYIVSSGSYVSGQLFPFGTNRPRGVGGPSVAQTIRDSWNNSQNVTLGGGVTYSIQSQLFANLALTDSQALFKIVDYFPTQNRWKGQIDNEVILFEGTSGGSPGITPTFSTINIVQRAIDGTVLSYHASGSVVFQLGPDTTYGVNLTTYEKAQYAYPHEITSGGIQGARVVPQTQSVYVFDGAGKSINGVLHFSGEVSLYDPTQQPIAFLGKEFAWVVERNGIPVQSGAYYGGQFAQYSKGPNSAPIYLVDGAGTQVPQSGTFTSGISGCGFPITYGFPIYDNNMLTILPCSFPTTLKYGGPPYPDSVISTLKNAYGINFLDYNGPFPAGGLVAGAKGVILQEDWFEHWKFVGGTLVCLCDNDGSTANDAATFGPYVTQEECEAACAGTGLPGNHYYCHLHFDGTVECNTEENLVGNDIDVNGPFTFSDCQTVCQPLNLNINGLWYCHQNPNGPYCNNNDQLQGMDTNVQGPFGTEADCTCLCNNPVTNSGSIPPNYLLWYCHKVANGTFYCTLNPNPNPGDVSITGPYPTQLNCVSNCQGQGGTTQAWYCHQSALNSICNQNPNREIGDLSIAGPFDSADACTRRCGSIIYRDRPGISFQKTYSPGVGDTGRSTANIKAVVSYPPPSAYIQINNMPPGGAGVPPAGGPGTNNNSSYNAPVSFINSCSIVWASYFDPACAVWDTQANWTGNQVYGNFGTTVILTPPGGTPPGVSCNGTVVPCPYPSVIAQSGLYASGVQNAPFAGVDTLKFDPCDFSLINDRGTCPSLGGVDIKTLGKSDCVQYLGPDCNIHTLFFRDGLYKGFN